ncbi:hypothetical protein [Mesorhizobium sp.]|uniref:SDH family Clp fold serine proteinase n=1 Tax=Mesorhizobium sp. TaxID=1871066 RepID=UPI000FE52028|nr:hypothetical protein [Mesorhizobium sp.]RWB69071.1 MAG: SppA protein [Mesorhizobium sp.]
MDTAWLDGDLANQIKEAEKADIYQYSGPISEEGLERLQPLFANPSYSRAILILTTGGGDMAAAYRIARQFHRVYDRLTVYIPDCCMSAGTLVALGAHDLIMHPNAEIGPIDPQLRAHNELCVRESALSSYSALIGLGDAAFDILERTAFNLAEKSEAGISFRLGSQVGANLATGLMAGLVSKLDPATIGTRQLAIDAVTQYGFRLVRASGNASEETVRRLVMEYPVHSFVIDYAEASELFNSVSEPSDLLKLYGTTLAHPEITIIRADPAEAEDEIPF